MTTNLKGGIAAALLVAFALPAGAGDFDFTACNIQGDDGFEPVLIVMLEGGKKEIRKGERGLDHATMFSPYRAEKWIKQAFPDETAGGDGSLASFCQASADNAPVVRTEVSTRIEIFDECTACEE